MADVNEEMSFVLAEPRDCPCAELGDLARKVGMSCQKIFERSYLHKGQTESFARAIFARLISLPQEAQALPKIVRDYCKKMPEGGNQKDTFRRGFCSGCMLNTDGVAGLSYAYSLIHPESVEIDAEGSPDAVLVEPEIERLYDKLIVSGSLDEYQGEYEDPSSQWQEE